MQQGDSSGGVDQALADMHMLRAADSCLACQASQEFCWQFAQEAGLWLVVLFLSAPAHDGC